MSTENRTSKVTKTFGVKINIGNYSSMEVSTSAEETIGWKDAKERSEKTDRVFKMCVKEVMRDASFALEKLKNDKLTDTKIKINSSSPSYKTKDVDSIIDENDNKKIKKNDTKSKLDEINAVLTKDDDEGVESWAGNHVIDLDLDKIDEVKPTKG